MKKGLILLVMVILFGCAHTPKTYTGEWWVKEGTSKEEIIMDARECEDPIPSFLKDDMNAYPKDFQFCVESEEARRRHKDRIVSGLSATAWIPYVGIVGAVATEITRGAIPTSGYAQRCMETKGYALNPNKREEFEGCMKAKGYVWGEYTETK